MQKAKVELQWICWNANFWFFHWNSQREMKICKETLKELQWKSQDKFSFFSISTTQNLKMHNFLCSQFNFISSNRALKNSLREKCLNRFSFSSSSPSTWNGNGCDDCSSSLSREFYSSSGWELCSRGRWVKRKKLENNPIYFNLQFTDVSASASNCRAL